MFAIGARAVSCAVVCGVGLNITGSSIQSSVHLVTHHARISTDQTVVQSTVKSSLSQPLAHPHSVAVRPVSQSASAIVSSTVAGITNEFQLPVSVTV